MRAEIKKTSNDSNIIIDEEECTCLFFIFFPINIKKLTIIVTLKTVYGL